MPFEVGLAILGAADAALGLGGGIFGFGLASATIGSVSLATIVGGAAILGASIGAQYYLNQKNAPKPQDGQQTVRQPLPVRRRSYGIVKVGGSILFSEASGGVRQQLLAINQGEIASYLQHWLDQYPVSLDGLGGVIGIYGGHVAIIANRGTDSETANGVIISRFPALWTSAHRARGIATVLVSMAQPAAKDYTKVFPGAKLPEYRAVIQSSKVWNPVQDGYGAKDNAAAWTFSENPVLQILDYHRHKDGLGLAYLDDVLITQAALDEDWGPAAAICAEAVALKTGGYEQRYRCAGNYPLNAPPKDVLAALLAACDGQTYQRPDGALGIRVGKTIAPTVTLTDDDIVSFEGMRRGGTAESIVAINQITAKYTSRDHDYQLTDAQAWRDENAISASGREESRDIDLSWVPSHSQARRLMKVAMARHRPEWSGRILTSLAGLKAYNERYVHLVIDDLGIDGSFEVGSFSIDPATLNCSIAVSALDPDVFEWDEDLEEGTPPPIPDQATEDTIGAPTGLIWSVSGGVISFSWNPSGRPDTDVVAQISTHGDDNWIDATIAENSLSASAVGLSPGYYDIRVYFKVGTREGDIAGQPNIHVT